MPGLFRNRPSLSVVLEKARAAFLRFPFVLLASFVFGASAIMQMETSTADEKWLLTCALAIPVFLTLALLGERFQQVFERSPVDRRIVELISGLILISAYHFLTKSDDTANYSIRYLQITLIAHLSVSFVSFIGKPGTSEFWQFNRQLFLRFALSSLYASVFYAGLAIALATTTTLFQIEFGKFLFGELFVVSVCLIQTWHFLAGVPTISDLRDSAEYPAGLRTFVQFLLIPLVSLYMVILYAYMAKILSTQDWPKGSIGWLVSAMAVLGVFNLLLIDPERKTNRWIGSYTRYFYILILPLLGLLFAAIGKRISEYGVTEPRYFLFVLGAWLAGIALYFLLSRSKNIKSIPISLAVLSLLTLMGPWGASWVSRRSQVSRAESLMMKLGAIENGKARWATKKAGDGEEKDLSSTLDYLLRHHGADSLSRWFAPELLVPPKGTSDSGRDSALLMSEMGLRYGDAQERKFATTPLWFGIREKSSLNISGFRFMMPLSLSEYGRSSLAEFRVGEKTLKVLLKPDAASLHLSFDSGEEKEISLADFVGRVRKEQSLKGPDINDFHEFKPEDLSLQLQLGSTSLTILFKSISGGIVNEKLTASAVEGWLLIK